MSGSMEECRSCSKNEVAIVHCRWPRLPQARAAADSASSPHVHHRMLGDETGLYETITLRQVHKYPRPGRHDCSCMSNSASCARNQHAHLPKQSVKALKVSVDTDSSEAASQ